MCLARAYTHHRKFVFVNSIIADMESMETLYKHGLLNESQNFFFKRRICYVSQMTVSHAFVAKHKSFLLTAIHHISHDDDTSRKDH